MENDQSLQLDTRNNKMPDNKPGVPNADNAKVKDCLSVSIKHECINSHMSVLKSSSDFVQHV